MVDKSLFYKFLLFLGLPLLSPQKDYGNLDKLNNNIINQNKQESKNNSKLKRGRPKNNKNL
jgi:hypothetical protein